MSQHSKRRLRLPPLQSALLGAAALAPGFLLALPGNAQTPTATQTSAGPQTLTTTQTPTTTQTTPSTFGGFSKNSGQPIDIESDVLVVHDAQKYATFKGNVKAVQGTTTIHSKELDVHCVGSGADSLTGGSPATGATADQAANNDPKAASTDAKAGDANAGGGVALGDNGTQISQIEAKGDVVITSDQDQTTTSDWALYDVPAQLVTVGGNVVLMQGKNVLKGERLVIDLKTGESRFENPGSAAAPSRIRALFMPKQDAKSGDGKNAKSGDDKANEKSDQSGKQGSGDEQAPGKAASSAAPPADSEAWQILPSQQ